MQVFKAQDKMQSEAGSWNPGLRLEGPAVPPNPALCINPYLSLQHDEVLAENLGRFLICSVQARPGE